MKIGQIEFCDVNGIGINPSTLFAGCETHDLLPDILFLNHPKHDEHTGFTRVCSDNVTHLPVCESKRGLSDGHDFGISIQSF